MNPFVALFENPVPTLTAAAYAVFLLTLLVATWWGLGRNLLYLVENWQDGWKLLIPGDYVAHLFATGIIVSVDLLLIAATIYVLTP